MRRCIKILLILLLFPITIVNADSIDISRNSSIKIYYKFNDNSITNMNTKIYKIADINTDYNYEYLEKYKDLEQGINNMSSSQVNEYAIELKEYIKNNNISSDDSITSNTDGIGSFTNLSVGLYLLIFDTLNNDNYEYKASPTLVTIPNYNEIDNNYTYDAELYAKIETTTISPSSDINDKTNNNKNNKSPTNKSLIPKTGDNIIIYITLLFISLLGITSIVLYKKSRKKELKDEKSN